MATHVTMGSVKPKTSLCSLMVSICELDVLQLIQRAKQLNAGTRKHPPSSMICSSHSQADITERPSDYTYLPLDNCVIVIQVTSLINCVDSLPIIAFTFIDLGTDQFHRVPMHWH